MKYSKNNIYALYKGDEFIDLGTAYELSQKLNIKESTIRFWATKTHRKRIENRHGQNAILAIKIGSANDDLS